MARPAEAESPVHVEPPILEELRTRMERALRANPDCDPPADAAALHRYWTVRLATYGGEEREPFTVGVMVCSQAAYNTTNIVLVSRNGGDVRLAPLPVAHTRVSYVAGSDEQRIRGIEITGFGATLHATDAMFDPTDATLGSYHRLRGLGDGSVMTRWRLTDEGFVLETHDIDPTFNGRRDPWRVVENGVAIAGRPLQE